MNKPTTSQSFLFDSSIPVWPWCLRQRMVNQRHSLPHNGLWDWTFKTWCCLWWPVLLTMLCAPLVLSGFTWHSSKTFLCLCFSVSISLWYSVWLSFTSYCFCEIGSIVYLGRTQHCCVLVTCVFRHLGQGQAWIWALSHLPPSSHRPRYRAFRWHQWHDHLDPGGCQQGCQVDV